MEIIAPRKHDSVCLCLRRDIRLKIVRPSSHPKVEDVAVMSIPDGNSSEAQKACVMLKPALRQGTAVDKGLIEYVKGKKVRYKWVKEVEFIEEIPKSPSGEFLRAVWRDNEKSGKFGPLVKMKQGRSLG
jgi:4-coumarate--CoA ligase